MSSARARSDRCRSDSARPLRADARPAEPIVRTAMAASVVNVVSAVMLRIVCFLFDGAPRDPCLRYWTVQTLGAMHAQSRRREIAGLDRRRQALTGMYGYGNLRARLEDYLLFRMRRNRISNTTGDDHERQENLDCDFRCHSTGYRRRRQLRLWRMISAKTTWEATWSRAAWSASIRCTIPAWFGQAGSAAYGYAPVPIQIQTHRPPRARTRER